MVRNKQYYGDDDDDFPGCLGCMFSLLVLALLSGAVLGIGGGICWRVFKWVSGS